MKKLLLITYICFIGLSSFAQDTTKVNKHPNEFGIDVTGFIKQFLNFNTSQFPTYYSPTYYLTYRRYFGCGNLRVEIGGDFMNNQVAPENTTDSNKYYDRSSSLYLSVGWEFYTNIGKRWQIFYGADFRPSFTYSKNDVMFWNGGYAQGQETQTQVYSVAPLLGVRLKLTKRLSILTETSYSIIYEQDNTKTYFTPLSGAPLPAPVPTSQKLTKMFSSYAQPLSLFLDFRI